MEKLNTVRVRLSLAANVTKNDFINGILEEAFMTVSLGFDNEEANTMCKLKTSLYGLKQSLRD